MPPQPLWFQDRLGDAYFDDLWPLLLENDPDLCNCLSSLEFTPAHLTEEHVRKIRNIVPVEGQTGIDVHLLQLRHSLLDGRRLLIRPVVRFFSLPVRCYKSNTVHGDFITPVPATISDRNSNSHCRVVLQPQPRWGNTRPGMSCSLSGTIINSRNTKVTINLTISS